MYFDAILNFFSQPSVGAILSFLGVVLAIVGIISYRVSRHKPKPAFTKYALRLLGHDDDSLPEDVTVRYREEIVQRLTKTHIIFWNAGTEVLHGNDIVASNPITFSFDDGDRILSPTVVARTRVENNCNLSPITGEPNKVRLSIDYLDPNDGVTIELLHDSERRFPKVTGTIRGVPNGIIEFRPPMEKIADDIPFFFEVLFKNPRLAMWAGLLLGLVLLAAGLSSTSDSLATLLGTSEMPEGLSQGLIIGGTVYTVLPLLTLWLSRKRHPKSLNVS